MTCLNSFLTNIDIFNLALAEFRNNYEKKRLSPGLCIKFQFLFIFFLITDKFFIKNVILYSNFYKKNTHRHYYKYELKNFMQ